MDLRASVTERTMKARPAWILIFFQLFEGKKYGHLNHINNNVCVCRLKLKVCERWFEIINLGNE